MWRRLQVVLSVGVIFICAAFLTFRLSSDEPTTLGPNSQTEISECHFLLQNGYVDIPDGLALVEAGGAALVPYLKEGFAGTDEWRNYFRGVTDEEALERLEDLVQKLVSQSGGKLGEQELVYTVLQGMTAGLEDPFTRVMDPDAYKKFQDNLHSRPFGGVGLQLGRKGKQVLVFTVLPDTPAAVAGVLAGDRLQSVDGKEISTLTVEEAEALLRGEVDTEVHCKFLRDGAVYTRVFIRVPLQTRSVRGRLVQFAGETVAYLDVKSMTSSTGQEFTEELDRLLKSEPAGLVVDLRDNFGGYVNEALEIASLFLPSGQTVVKINSRDETELKQTISGQPVALPMVLVVNERTASTSEILAACLQDYQRAKVVGHRTFGKGSVQNIHEFESGGALKFTVARYTTPQGRTIDGVGLLPDEVLEKEEDILRVSRTLWRPTKK